MLIAFSGRLQYPAPLAGTSASNPATPASKLQLVAPALVPTATLRRPAPLHRTSLVLVHPPSCPVGQFQPSHLLLLRLRGIVHHRCGRRCQYHSMELRRGQSLSATQDTIRSGRSGNNSFGQVMQIPRARATSPTNQAKRTFDRQSVKFCDCDRDAEEVTKSDWLEAT